VAKANSAFIKGYEDIQGFSKENISALVEAGTIFAKGAEAISKQVMALTQSSMQSSVGAAKAMLGCKTLREAIDLQADYARSNFDAMVAEGTKLGEMSFKVANDAIAPIQARVNVAVEKMAKPIAA
jgi:phasin family protein